MLGSAWLLQNAGLSAGLGAFLAGVILADSEFRHELEAQIQPFEGLLLGLFFMAVGMSIDLRQVAAEPAVVPAEPIPADQLAARAIEPPISPAPISATSRAAVPELRAKAWDTPTRSATSRSKASTWGPSGATQPERTASRT